MGWESNNVFQVLIITGSTGSGVFVYSPSPGAGNLVASIAATGGTDPYGNVFQSGIVSYSGAAFAALKGAQVQVTGGGATEVSAHMQAASGVNTLTSGGTTGADTQGTLQIESVAGSGTATPVVLVPTPALLKATGGAAITGGTTTDTLHTTGTSTFDAKETITAGGLSVTGGVTDDTEFIASAQAGGLLLRITNSAGGATAAAQRITVQTAGDDALDTRVAGDTNSRIIIGHTANSNRISLGSGAAAVDQSIGWAATNLMSVIGADFDISTAGRGLQIKEGTNARMGTATLAGGTVVVANTSVTANTRIFLTSQTTGAAPGAVRVSARTAGTSFTISSSSGTDTSVVAWLLVEPG